jgi:hypothetical protein
LLTGIGRLARSSHLSVDKWQPDSVRRLDGDAISVTRPAAGYCIVNGSSVDHAALVPYRDLAVELLWWFSRASLQTASDRLGRRIDGAGALAHPLFEIGVATQVSLPHV